MLCPVIASFALSGATASAAVSDAGFTWGSGFEGLLGDGGTSDSDVPTPIGELGAVSAVSAGSGFDLALLDNGTVTAWGSNDAGALGDGVSPGEQAHSDVPVPVSNLVEVTAVAAGAYNSLALLDNGTVAAWGSNFEGGYSDVPVAVGELTGVIAIAAGGSDLALLGDGTVAAWGRNDDGQLGDGSTTDSSAPVAVSGVSDATAISTDHENSLALLGDGTVAAWGSNEDGQLGDAMTPTEQTHSDVPVKVSDLSEATAVSSGGDHDVALLRDGTVMAWGDNERGQLGIGSTGGYRDVPVAVKGLSGVVAVSAGPEFSLALLSDGSVVAWGDNSNGQLGDRDTVDSDVPVAVIGLEGAVAISAGSSSQSVAVAEPSGPLPTIASVTPSHGPAAGGTAVTITGTNFSGATEVMFGATRAASFKVQSDTSIVAISPPDSGTAAVDVGVAAPGVISATGPGDRFGYPAPVIEGERAWNITEHSATLEAEVEPEGPEEGSAGPQEATYEIRLATYGECLESCEILSEERVSSGRLLADGSAQTVSADVSGLQPHWHYSYRVIATNSAGTTTGPGTWFTAETRPSPETETTAAASVSRTTATLGGSIDPLGELEVRYSFEYGTTQSYGASTPSGTIGGPPSPCGIACEIKGPHEVSASLSGLQPGTTYHYRLVASSGWEVGYGQDATFTMASDSLEPVIAPPTAPSGPPNPPSAGPIGPSSGLGLVVIRPGKPDTALRNARLLAHALKLCAKRPAARRAACRRQARRKYAAAARKRETKSTIRGPTR